MKDKLDEGQHSGINEILLNDSCYFVEVKTLDKRGIPERMVD